MTTCGPNLTAPPTVASREPMRWRGDQVSGDTPGYVPPDHTNTAEFAIPHRPPAGPDATRTDTPPDDTPSPPPVDTITDLPADDLPADDTPVPNLPADDATVTDLPADDATITDLPADVVTITDLPADDVTDTGRPADEVSDLPGSGATVTDIPIQRQEARADETLQGAPPPATLVEAVPTETGPSEPAQAPEDEWTARFGAEAALAASEAPAAEASSAEHGVQPPAEKPAERLVAPLPEAPTPMVGTPSPTPPVPPHTPAGAPAAAPAPAAAAGVPVGMAMGAAGASTAPGGVGTAPGGGVPPQPGGRNRRLVVLAAISLGVLLVLVGGSSGVPGRRLVREEAGGVVHGSPSRLRDGQRRAFEHSERIGAADDRTVRERAVRAADRADRHAVAGAVRKRDAGGAAARREPAARRVRAGHPRQRDQLPDRPA